MYYSESKINRKLLRGLEEMGFTEMTPIQELAVPQLLEGRDVIGQAQTGTGKTAAFAVPMIENLDPRGKSVQGLVLCPTRELAIQAAEEIGKMAKYMTGVKVAAIYGGQEISRQLRLLKSRISIVIGTPGRVMDHMRRGSLKLENLKMLVLDEADEMLNMGFRDDIETICEALPEDSSVKARPLDFVTPLVVLLAVGIAIGGDLAIACLVAIAFEMVWFIARRLMTFAEFMDSFWKGMFGVFKPTVYLMVGFTLTTILKLIGFPELVQAVAGFMVPGVALAFFFVAAAAIGTLTGMFWPTTSLFLAACLPVTDSMGISPFVLAAVLFSAATFGSVISPRGALVMFIGEELGSNAVDLTRSLRPYALIAGALTLVFYLVLGFVAV